MTITRMSSPRIYSALPVFSVAGKWGCQSCYHPGWQPRSSHRIWGLPKNAGLTGKRHDRILEHVRKMLTDLTPQFWGRCQPAEIWAR
jgi:hypothetical protein